MHANGFSGSKGFHLICARPISEDKIDRFSLPDLLNQEVLARTKSAQAGPKGISIGFKETCNLITLNRNKGPCVIPNPLVAVDPEHLKFSRK